MTKLKKIYSAFIVALLIGMVAMVGLSSANESTDTRADEYIVCSKVLANEKVIEKVIDINAANDKEADGWVCGSSCPYAELENLPALSSCTVNLPNEVNACSDVIVDQTHILAQGYAGSTLYRVSYFMYLTNPDYIDISIYDAGQYTALNVGTSGDSCDDSYLRQAEACANLVIAACGL